MPPKPKIVKSTNNQSNVQNNQQNIIQNQQQTFQAIPQSSLFSSFNSKQPSISFTTSNTASSNSSNNVISPTNTSNFASFGGNIMVGAATNQQQQQQQTPGTSQRKIQQQMVQVFILKNLWFEGLWIEIAVISLNLWKLMPNIENKGSTTKKIIRCLKSLEFLSCP